MHPKTVFQVTCISILKESKTEFLEITTYENFLLNFWHYSRMILNSVEIAKNLDRISKTRLKSLRFGNFIEFGSNPFKFP